MDITGENLRILLGVKLRQLREGKGYSLKILAEKTNLSISYLSEVEKGKKYPKPEKILQLAKALDVSFDELVSLKIGEELNSLTSFFSTPFIQEFPFRFFGIAPREVVDLITHSPVKASALLRTFLEIGRTYDMQVEHFLFAALRSYQKMHQNFFEDLENAAAAFLNEHQWKPGTPISKEQLRTVLVEKYGYVVDEETLSSYPELQGFRSIWVNSKPPKLLINEKLLPPQKAFILGREIGYIYLNLKERAATSSWLKIESFDQLLNNFKASYFSGAMLINQELMKNELEKFFQNERWDEQGFLAIMERYQLTPEMLFYRLSQLIPRLFNLQETYYLRFYNEAGSEVYRLTKELNMSRMLVPHGIGLNENYCRRWLSISLLNELAERQKRRDSQSTIIAAQRSRFVESDAEFFTITIARPLILTEGTNSSITLGFLLNDEFKKIVRFWNDPNIPSVNVNETCERCGLTAVECSDRVASPGIYEREQNQKVREQVLQQLMRDVK